MSKKNFLIFLLYLPYTRPLPVLREKERFFP